MRIKYAIGIRICLILVLAAAAAKYYPRFPGDVAVERCVQSLFPPNLNWAQWVSRTAEFPMVLVILALVFGFSGSWPAGVPQFSPSSACWECGSWAPCLARSSPGRGLPWNWCASFDHSRVPASLRYLP